MTIPTETLLALCMFLLTSASLIVGVWWNLNRRIEGLRIRLAEHQTAMAEKLGERVTSEILDTRLARIEDMVRQEIRDLRAALTGAHFGGGAE